MTYFTNDVLETPDCLRQLPGERPVAVVKAMRNEELWL